MDTKVNLETKKISPIFELQWDALPFFSKNIILWRDITIQIEIKDEVTTGGSKTTFTFIHNNQSSAFGTAKWKGSGGSFGEKPVIKTATHSILISASLKYLLLREETFP